MLDDAITAAKATAKRIAGFTLDEPIAVAEASRGSVDKP
jgi:hypothetical protein